MAETREAFLRRTAGSQQEAKFILNKARQPEQNALSLILGPWTFEFTPDGDDPGVGNLTIRSTWGRRDMPLVQTTQDDVQRGEWDAFVRGATL